MSEAEPPTETQERPALASLLVELTRDARSFANAEVAYLKAQAGERAHFAVPGLIMIGIAIALGFGTLVAVPVSLIWLLAPMIGAGWATLAVTVAGLAVTVFLLNLGMRRVKAVMKRPEDR
ncbi:MAG: phage holin family protein [Pseudomonadota bacterium]